MMRSSRTFGAYQPGFQPNDSQDSSFNSSGGYWNASFASVDQRKMGAEYTYFRPSNASVDTQSDYHTTENTTNSSYLPYAAQSVFTAANDTVRPEFRTIHPLKAHFEQHDTKSNSHISPVSTETSTKYDGGSKRRKDSLSPKSTSSPGGRKRGSEDTEVAPARALYLEKNRAAASKCRNKQRRQQEELVEEAREVERRNRVLKAEADMLRGGIRELMHVAAQHNDCPDTRIKLYLQRKADWIATGGLSRMEYVPSSEMSPRTHGSFPLKEETP
jgi:cyclic AMP-dependent transcription factor ATF-2